MVNLKKFKLAIFIAKKSNFIMLFNILIIGFITLCILLIWRYYNRLSKPKWQEVTGEMQPAWKKILCDNVSFYEELTPEDKMRFEKDVMEFLANCRVTGVQLEVQDLDKLLVASSAVIPIFGFPDWRYPNVREVILYPDSFDENFQFEGNGMKNILGMVGNQSLEGVVILSKRALEHGFKNDSDKMNTAIHEFIHLIDKADGTVDGIPQVIMNKQYVLPWIDLIHHEMNRISQGDSDINPYAATNTAEFLAVISEYFFERPKLLEKNHPKLYALLETFFKQDMAEKIKN